MTVFEKIKSAAWFKPLRNAGVVTVGKIVQAVMGLGYTALAARALGPSGFGMLALIHGLVFGLSQIIRFQTWQAVIRYGADAIHNDDTSRLQRLVKFSTALDILGAVIGLTLILLLIGPAGHWFDIPPDLHGEIRVYALSLGFMVLAATPLGILRLLDRFEMIAVQTTINPAVRLIGTIYLFLTGGGLFGFLVTWFAGTVISRLVLLAMGWYELARRGFLKGLFARHDRQWRPEPGIWRFVLAHNLSRGLFISQAHIGLLLVGWLLGPAAAGLYKIAQQFADVLAKPANKLLMPAIYPELAKLQRTEDYSLRRSMILRTGLLAALLAGGILAVMALFGKGLIATLFGSDYIGAYGVMLWLAFAGLFTVLAFPLEPLLSASGRMRQIVTAYFMATIVNVLALVVLVPLFELQGAGMAAVGAILTSTVIMGHYGRDLFLKGAPLPSRNEFATESEQLSETEEREVS